ncbi:MAG: Wzz/FepE/Etk N-terminal domain-containing protein [Pseudomonadota bacterium]
MTANNQMASRAEPQQDLDLAGLLGALRSRIGAIFVVSLVLTALVFVVLQFMTPLYRAETRVHIVNRDAVLSRNDSARQLGTRAAVDQEDVASQEQILQSRDIARKVVVDLDLAKMPEFDKALRTSFVTGILVQLGLVKDPTEQTQQERVLKTFFEKLKVYQVERSRIVAVQFRSENPRIAAEVPKAIVTEYLRLQEIAKRGVDPNQVQVLEQELDKLRADVKAAEAAVANFRGQSDVLIGRNNATLATQQLGDLSNELARVRAQRSDAVSQAKTIRSVLEQGGSVESLSRVLESQLIQRLRERQVALKSQIADLSTTLLSGHPRIRRLNSQLVNLDAQIRSEARKVLASLESDARIARAREKDLLSSVNGLKAEAARVEEAQVELRALEREANARRELLQTYLLKYNDATTGKGAKVSPADARVISTAVQPSDPYFPKKLPILIATFLGSMMLGIIGVLAVELMGRPVPAVAPAVRSAAKEEDAAIEDASSKEEVIAVAAAKSQEPTAEADRAIEGAVPAAQSIAMLGAARVAMLSPEGASGSEGTVLLARYLASKGSSVVVVDLTGQGASSKTMLSNPKEAGIKDLLAGRASFADVIHSDACSHAHIIPTGLAKAEDAAAAHERLYMIFDALDETYDYVLIDCGAADVAGLSKISKPNTVNVINQIDDRKGTVKLAGELLTQAGFKSPITLQPTLEERQMMGTCAA